MPGKKQSIPVRSFSKELGTGIAVGRVSSETFHSDEETKHSHRHDEHFFVLQEKGSSITEIDFETHLITEPSVLYQSPNQVHRALKIEQVEMYILVISDENLKTDYRKLLQQISPTKPLPVQKEDLSIIQQAFSLCNNLYERTDDHLHFSLLKDSCNALIALIISQYLKNSKPVDRFSRFEIIENEFTNLLENSFTYIKRPSDYAKELNISTPYLNECIKNVTGFSASYKIQQRVILEAKRLLFHTTKSVKEIANELGYDDYAYFSRLFNKATGMTALTFRNQNHD